MKKKYCLLILAWISLQSMVLGEQQLSLPEVNAYSIIQNKEITWSWQKASTGTVIVFLSYLCPCSIMNIDYLENLSHEFKNYTFIAIHSNANENVEKAKQYFLEKKISFDVVSDDRSHWANILKAHRTPHSYIIDKLGKIIYQGGISDSSNPSKASAFYLKSALTNFQNGKPIISSQTRVLGCKIQRY